MDSERKGTGQILFSSSFSVFCILWVAGLDFSALFWMTKEADTEGISFPEPAELAESSPHPFARMREMPAQHSPFQRSPLLPPACCKRTGSINHSRHSVLCALQRVPALVCPAGDVHTHVQRLAHTLAPAHACQ